MLKLYGSAFSRASIVKWYLEELAIPYEFVTLDMQAGEHRQDGFLQINPFGKVPAIVEDNGFKLWESGAILMYLAEKYAETPVSPEKRAELNQWIIFANATLGPGIFVEANREREMPRLMTALDSILEKQPYLVSDEFSVADVAVGSLLLYIPIMLKLDLSAYPAVLDYMKRISDRAGYQKSMGKI
ncbi:MAG: glutathione S-transferase family protein [Methylacidiphilales bacterium]|nr:glutathione S-transferase family protein [Candidatus Methylacidiphilales bacterium]